MAAHPRSRGENGHATHVLKSDHGSSPLTRGKRVRLRGRRQGRRLIPAHAGKTSGDEIRACRVGAHPRSRGENPDLKADTVRAAGSSPLTRGKLTLDDPAQVMRGLIPAHAGKTGRHGPQTWSRTAHPRSRGENEAELSPSSDDSGSSPLTRGKPTGARRTRARSRLIPAHAGKTYRTKRSTSGASAHPRSRGENSLNSWSRTHSMGSSPLTRGKLVRSQRPLFRGRLIPAHAGKTYVGLGIG